MVRRGHDDRDQRTTAGRRHAVRRAVGRCVMGAELVIDGPRPAVEWVRRLPRRWTATTSERLLLYVLALDTYDQLPPFEASPKLGDLAEWCGVYKGTVSKARDALAAPVDDVRPALLEVTLGTGRARSVYRLCTESGPALWPDITDHKTRHSVRAEPTTTSGRTDPTTNGRSGLRSGLGSVRAEPTTPFPLPNSSSVVTEVQDTRASCAHRRRTADGDCLDCGATELRIEANA